MIHQGCDYPELKPEKTAPVRRSKEQASRAYDRMSRWYDWIAGSSERRYREAGLSILHAGPGETILDLGCGTGQSTAELVQAVSPGGLVLALDLSEKMARITNQRISTQNETAGGVVVIGDGAQIPVRSNTLDAVFISFTLELFHTEELLPVLKHCQRALKPDGRLVLVSMEAQTKPSLITRAYLAARRIFPAFLDCRPIPVRSLLESAGFSIRETRKFSMYGFPIIVIEAGLAP